MTLRANPQNQAAVLALAVYSRVLEAVRADRLVEVAVQRADDVLVVQGRPYDLSLYSRVRVVGVGKASVAMAKAIVGILPDRIHDGLIVTKRGHAEPVPGVEVIEAGHPVPDEDSMQAGERTLRFAQECNEQDLVLFVLSGGASALMELPTEGVTLDELQETNRLLLASGADITQMNAIRSRISRLKAGGLARAFAPATVVALVLSDVVGNSLATIGSGPLIGPKNSGDLPTNLIDQLPAAVRSEVLAGQLLPRSVPAVDHYIVGSVSVAVHAAADAAKAIGLDALPFQDPLQGEARSMARQICSVAQRHAQARPDDWFCLIFGGETTVKIRGNGKGGRCQEMAVAAAPAIARIRDAAFLAAGTDGTDGPTDAAGGVVDTDLLLRAKNKGLDHRRALVQNDTYPFLEQTDGLIISGPTGSNVNDLCLVVHAPS